MKCAHCSVKEQTIKGQRQLIHNLEKGIRIVLDYVDRGLIVIDTDDEGTLRDLVDEESDTRGDEW